MKTPRIVDDGTMDTVVLYRDSEYRFSTEYRQEFENDDEFLCSALDQIKEELAQ
tara:strand:+ start:142 stop:303 length:162 start_codon:yes stop_codon:yes gene_type:complete